MAQTFLKTMFGPGACALQERDGSRASYARLEAQAGEIDVLTGREMAFIATRESFYMASVSEAGWPYLQHRGGPPGFLRHLSGNRIGFADYQGNRQFLSTANLAHDDRVSLFLIDYPARRRLKLIGHAQISDAPDQIAALMPSGYAATGERAFVIDVVGFDWNCPQHITPRFTAAQIEAASAPLHAEIARLRAALSQVKDQDHDR